MKRLVNVTEVEGDGLVKLLGEQVQVWCLNYIYTGKLTGVNERDLCLEDASIVYETGKLTDKGFKDAQSVGVKEWFVRLDVVEAYALVK